MKKFINRYYIFIVAFVLLVSFILRFYNLSGVPSGLYQDETAIGYNAYSILMTGKDEYGKENPLYFKSFGDHKLPVYIYITSVSEKIFGVNAFAVRFPSALFGSLTIIVLYFLVRKVSQRPYLALLSAGLLAVNPWHFHFSRAGFEVNIALFFALTASLFLVLSRNKMKWQLLLLLLSVLFYILSLYSYNVTRLLSPVLAVSVLMIYKNDFLKVSKKIIVLSLIFGGVLISPFLLSITSQQGASSAGGALITSGDIQAKTLEFRSYFIEYPIFAKLFFNKWVLMIWTYLENLASIVNANFFFVTGSMHGNQGIGTSGVFHVFQLPLFIAGIIGLVKGNIGKLTLFTIWGVIALLVLALSKEVPHATRGYFLVIPVTVFSAAGILYLLKHINLRMKYIKPIVIGLFILVAIFNSIYFFSSYFIRFPIFYAKQWRQQDELLVNHLIINDEKYDRIIFDNATDFIYTSYLFYSKYDPKTFYSQVRRLPDDNEGFSKVEGFGKVQFKDVNWTRDATSRTLIITTKDNKPKELPAIATFDFPTRPVVVSLKEKIFEFPVTDNAYVLVEGKE